MLAQTKKTCQAFPSPRQPPWHIFLFWFKGSFVLDNKQRLGKVCLHSFAKFGCFVGFVVQTLCVLLFLSHVLPIFFLVDRFSLFVPSQIVPYLCVFLLISWFWIWVPVVLHCAGLFRFNLFLLPFVLRECKSLFVHFLLTTCSQMYKPSFR